VPLRIPGPGPTHPREIFRSWLTTYYCVLNADSAFQEALEVLFKGFQRSTAPRRGPLSPLELQVLIGRRRLGMRAHARGGATTERMHEAFREFAEEWKLPERSWQWPKTREMPDLFFSFLRWHRGRRKAKLLVGPMVLLIAIRPAKIEIEAQRFTYDITGHSPEEVRKEIDRRLAALRKDAFSQIAKVEDEARSKGWKDFPLRHRDPEERQRLAFRVYRRAILGQSWPAIAKADHVDPRSVFDSTRRLARCLGIPLPHRRGRPRKRK